MWASLMGTLLKIPIVLSRLRRLQAMCFERRRVCRRAKEIGGFGGVYE